jgi:type VI secretion system secreted protein VgrG
MTTDARDALVFRTEALEPGSLRLLKLRGREAISTLYRMDLLLEAQGAEPLDPAAVDGLLGTPAHVAFGDAEEHPFHGVIRSVALDPSSSRVRALYRVTLVPRLWGATRTRRCRVFQEMTVPEIVLHVLSEHGMAAGKEVELRASAPHPKREYTVQYQETDYAFLCRLLEHEGMFYFFEHSEAGALTVIADANFAFPAPAETNPIPFVAASGALGAPSRGVFALGHRARVVERAVELRDYNYRIPSVALEAEADVDEAGVGLVFWYGEHFKDPDDGARLAALRAEELRARKHVYEGRSSAPGIRSGHRLALEGHFAPALDQVYAVVEVRHAADQGWSSQGGGAPEGYRCRFAAIPFATAFRPRRRTPKPKIAGVLHAKVDGGQKTWIDEHGRYRILLPFDTATPGTGSASRWIRRAQPLSGPTGKMHFPLEVGTEVLLGHIDGDPDRPIIVGAVPNHETPSPVVARNMMQNVVETRSGIRMIFDDEAGPT